MPANLENSAVATGLEKVSFHSNPKECSNYRTVALISHASKVMLKILQARLQQYMNCELTDVQAGFRKGRGTRDQIVNICWIIGKAREFQKNIYFCFIDYAKPLTVWISINCGKFWKRWVLGACTQDPTHDKVTRRKPDRQGRSGFQGFQKAAPGAHLKKDICLSDACFNRLLPNFCDTGRRPSPISSQIRINLEL